MPYTFDGCAARPRADRVMGGKEGGHPIRRAGRIIAVIAFCSTLLAGGTSQKERKVISRIAPVYPDVAKRMHLGGIVKLQVVVRTNGTVKSVMVLGGSPSLIGSATFAVQKWKFEPASQETTELIQVSFDLTGL
jgi:TonB family protein